MPVTFQAALDEGILRRVTKAGKELITCLCGMPPKLSAAWGPGPNQWSAHQTSASHKLWLKQAEREASDPRKQAKLSAFAT
eukprot:scaffold100490_cov59-Phaeocystis_antarctica.AAC.1